MIQQSNATIRVSKIKITKQTKEIKIQKNRSKKLIAKTASIILAKLADHIIPPQF